MIIGAVLKKRFSKALLSLITYHGMFREEDWH